MDKDPIEFIEEAYQVVAVIHILSEEKAKLVVYQLKGVTKICYEQWVDKRVKEWVLSVGRNSSVVCWSCSPQLSCGRQSFMS